MTNVLPPIWLLVFLASAAFLPEAIYTPALPTIARNLRTSESMVEYTLTLYLLGFALGTLFFGKISDRWGRKPCVIGGLIIFMMGCFGCYYAPSIQMLMLSRLVQAFGASIGSVLGQAMARDSFHGTTLGKVFSTVGSALSLCPILGPVIGGAIVEYYDWRSLFLLLIAFALILLPLVVCYLPETHHASKRQSVSVSSVALSLLQDKKVMTFAFMVAGCNGITFSYLAEGPFYLINLLGLTPGQYGSSFIIIGLSLMAGGLFSRYLHHRHTSQCIMEWGIKVIGVFAILFSVFMLIHTSFFFADSLVIGFVLLMQMGLYFGVGMTGSNALALALVNYKHCIGTASSLFGFFYYALISLFTLGMGMLHNGTLLPMPLYFLALSVFMVGVKRSMLKD